MLIPRKYMLLCMVFPVTADSENDSGYHPQIYSNSMPVGNGIRTRQGVDVLFPGEVNGGPAAGQSGMTSDLSWSDGWGIRVRAL